MPQHKRMAISLQRVIRTTSCFGSRVGFSPFSGTWIELRYLRFEQIQYGGHRHVGKISSGDIPATGRPIHIMFCSRVRFSGTADLMVLFPVRTNPRWRPPPSWKKFKLAISPQPVVRSTSCLVQWRRQTRGVGCVRTGPLSRRYIIFLKQDSALKCNERY